LGEYILKMLKDKSSICFISLRAYSLLSGTNYTEVKGPNVRQVIIARELVKKGFNVGFICYSNVNPDKVEYLDSVKVLKIPEHSTHPSFLTKIMDSFKILKLIHKSNSDVYIHTGGFLGVLPILLRKKNIFMMASDAWVDPEIIPHETREYKKSKLNIDNIGTSISIKKADLVVVQNTFQRDKLKSIFKVEGKLIKNPLEIKKYQPVEKTDPPLIIWVGSMAEVKQPELLVKIAKKIPEAKFQIIGGNSHYQLYKKVMETAQDLENLEYVGVVPFDQIDTYFSQASLLLNTSLFEGFPTSFLQAWSHHTPVVSLNADPDHLLSRGKLGICSQNLKQMILDIKQLLDNPELRKEMGSRGRKYVEKEHDASLIVESYIQSIKSIY
jgi:glycosyltransferase involved in cell wall biosynthesis